MRKAIDRGDELELQTDKLRAEVELCYKNLKLFLDSLANVAAQRDAAQGIVESANLQVSALRDLGRETMKDMGDLYRVSSEDLCNKWDVVLNSKAKTVWQPIETSPRDGTHVLIYIPKEDPTSQCVKEAWWSIPHEDATLEQGGWQTMGGVVLSKDVHKTVGATHWTSLPMRPIAE